MFQDISYEHAKERSESVQWIDVRSQAEYSDSHIPGAVNIPLFTNEERAKVGTVYKQIGKQAAIELGIRLTAAKLPDLIQHTRNVAHEREVVLYCWRGGMRSKSMATFLDLAGLPVFRLDQGYRGFRSYITRRLESARLKGVGIIIHGMTGTGKSQLLRKLANAGEPVIDLEFLAGHKGSAFGSIGETPNNQRTFDALLVASLDRIGDPPHVIMEAKSQRIGRTTIPDFLWNKRFGAIHVRLETPMAIRVARILQKYVVDDAHFSTKVERAFTSIEKRLSTADKQLGWAAIHNRHYAQLVELMLEKYYDDRYREAMKRYTDPIISLPGEDLDKCKDMVLEIAKDAKVQLQEQNQLHARPVSIT